MTQVGATDFYITSPYSVTSWKIGENAKITWRIIPGGPEISSVSIDLMDGDDANAHVLAPITSGLSPDSIQYEWTVPKDFPQSPTAFIRLSGSGSGSTVYRFSHRFSILTNTGKQPEKSQRSDVVIASQTIQTSNVQQTTTTTGSTRSSPTKSKTSVSWPTDDADPIPTNSVTILHRQVGNSATTMIGTIRWIILLGIVILLQ